MPEIVQNKFAKKVTSAIFHSVYLKFGVWVFKSSALYILQKCFLLTKV